MSKICPNCGGEIHFRNIGGRVIPFGCLCRFDAPPRLHEAAKKIEPVRSTFRTTCPICHSPNVFFIRHNGGCVWVDALGDPWPKHPCFADTEKGVEAFFPGTRVTCLGTVRHSDAKDWLGRPVLVANCSRFFGSVIVLSSDGPLPEDDTLVTISEDCSVLRSAEGGVFRISDLVRRCQHCDELFISTEYESHRLSCHKNGYVTCQICKKKFHWTKFGSHRASHRSG